MFTGFCSFQVNENSAADSDAFDLLANNNANAAPVAVAVSNTPSVGE